MSSKRNPSAQICTAIERLLVDEDAKPRALAFSDLIAKWDGPKIAAGIISEKYGS